MKLSIFNTRRSWLELGLLLMVLGLLALGRNLWIPMVSHLIGKRTVETVLVTYGPAANARLQPYFSAAGVTYPPREVVLLADKAEQVLSIWARGDTDEFRWIRTYDILKTSGGPGPKLREGDFQVPEGIYRIIGLNPNSAYHLSLKLDYPNAFDLHHAQAEGRDQPGSNIFIHGQAVSVGCLAMGDTVIEELFVLAAQVGISAFTVVIAPHDPRRQALVASPNLPAWTTDLYAQITAAFAPFPLR